MSGALAGGGVVAVVGVLWNRFHGPQYPVVFSDSRNGPGQMPGDGRFGPGFGQEGQGDQGRGFGPGFGQDGPGQPGTW
ncbi:hypothetical protein ACFFHJ_03795 [Planotetraspora thailandica]|uniref:hypothetical protein n=1 Tax=Planotetraspora thailandica TaxID=487172 RepID=UPI001951B74C|nr:hypothetical protein [Planotetraspora thailandica]